MRYTSGEANGKPVGPFGGNTGGRYVWTEKQGWIDLGHFFQVAAEGEKKLGGSDFKKFVAKTIGRGHVNSQLLEKTIEIEDSQGPGSSWSYEDPSSNKAGADFLLDYFSGDDTLMESLDSYMEDVGASSPESAPNWGTMQEKAHKGSLLYEKSPRNLEPVLNPQLKDTE